MAEAFWAGKTRKRGNCETDGEVYRLEDHPIARRVDLTARVAYALQNDGKPWPNEHTGEAQYSFADWPTKMTARHLSALGVNAECYGVKNPRIELNGKVVEPSEWYTLVEIEALVNPPKPAREPKFVNLTMELFPS